MKTTKGMQLKTVWKLCIEMWDWIAEQTNAKAAYPDGRLKDIGNLKTEWADDHGYKLQATCFFCDYAIKRGGGCKSCPGQSIEPRFGCGNKGYDYKMAPLKFHAKLHRMYKKFLKESK